MTSVNATTLVEEEQNQANLARKRDLKNAGAAAALSVRRLNVMRIGYAVMGVGIVRNRPLLVNRTEPWPLYEGVTKYMLVAMGLLALLGLRYPVKMLPILLLESAWK